MTKYDTHQLGIEWWYEMELESTRDLSENGEWLFSIGGSDDYPGDESESYSHERISDHGYEEEGLGYIRIR